jgi:outer membrane protein
MKNGLLALNGLLLIAVGVLFYLHFTEKRSFVTSNNKSPQKTLPDTPFRIAYFEIDSVSEHFALVKDVRAELDRRQDSMNNELERLDKSYRDKMSEYQNKAASMSQVQSESATQDLLRMQDFIKNRKQELDQKYNDLVTRKMNSVKAKIEEFLKEYNKDNRYNYIISYEPGLFYYKDPAFNITDDVVKGLNEMYKSKKD